MESNSYEAKEIVISEFNSLRGRLCTVIESASLPRRQEVALKTLLKQISYQNQSVITQLIELLDNDDKFQYVGTKINKC